MRLSLKFLIVFMTMEKICFAAEAGMPQLDPKYWYSQAFWLITVFAILYFSVSNFFIPKIKKNLDDRENKIKDDLDEANNLKKLSEVKQKEYEEVIAKAKKDVLKIFSESKSRLESEINKKKQNIENQINLEIEKAQKEIQDLKKNSVASINKISEELTSKIIEEVIGDKLNESSIKAMVGEVSKKEIKRNL